MGSWFRDTFAALAERNFRILWTGSLLAFIAFFMSTVVQSVVAFDLSGNNRAVGFVVFAQGIAQLALGPLGGALADRLSKKTVILACQTTIFSAFVALGLLVATDVITIGYLAGGSFVIGVAFSFLGPSRQAFMLELVDGDRRGNAVALSQVALNASRIVAPLVAGAMLAVGFLGAAGAFLGMGVLYVGAIVCTIVLPPSRTPSGTSRSVLGDIASGLAYVRDHARLRRLVLSYVLVIMFGFTYVTLLPGLVENELHRDAKSITLLLGVNAVGGLGASIGVASRADSRHARTIYTVMCLIFGLSLLAQGFAPSYAFLAVAMFFGGLGAGGFQTLNGAIVSHITEPEYFGRVVSLTFLAFAASSIFALPVGFLADAIGERPTIWITGSIVTAATAMFWLLERAAESDSVPVPAAATAGD
ncbi:MFS transporter [Candidatus Amarobacter glycogenicus]|uniref:MFS transporter n=1 Tax=Candidatus Amarobacter glycogenicus TaxID=3140699 RepID=UPI002A11E674|nr:MFS transporter [Dehalococcoidia bacterium]